MHPFRAPQRFITIGAGDKPYSATASSTDSLLDALTLDLFLKRPSVPPDLIFLIDRRSVCGVHRPYTRVSDYWHPLPALRSALVGTSLRDWLHPRGITFDVNKRQEYSFPPRHSTSTFIVRLDHHRLCDTYALDRIHCKRNDRIHHDFQPPPSRKR